MVFTKPLNVWMFENIVSRKEKKKMTFFLEIRKILFIYLFSRKKIKKKRKIFFFFLGKKKEGEKS